MEHVVSQFRKRTISPSHATGGRARPSLRIGTEEESEEEPVGDTEGANSDTDSGETVTYSIAHGEDTSSEELYIEESFHRVRPQEVVPTVSTIPPRNEKREPQPDPGAQQSEDTSEDSDAIIEALDDRLVLLQGVVDLNDSA
ncbi:hypothetical protein L1987_48800 [Smallanthus sonchifolius]|uniref:Uncharacterized protein n=1 Tax=Smallanthus sonchifolius TaxID=185202 RepID=A0ACB9FUL4_9ASTR|nr:hypothetical protein L1987_48800 [Smallanthus sonchifolius]